MSDVMKDLKAAVEAFYIWPDEPEPYRNRPRSKGVLACRLVSNHGEELLKLVEGERWIPVSERERLPESGTWSLILWTKQGPFFGGYTEESDGAGWFHSRAGEDDVISGVTHWRVLKAPTPPQEA